MICYLLTVIHLSVLKSETVEEWKASKAKKGGKRKEGNKRKKKKKVCLVYSVQFSSVAQSCPTLCDPMNQSMPVHHQLPEFTQTHVHRVGDAIQPSHPYRPLLLLPPIPPSIRVFSNESTLRMRWPTGVSASASVLPMNTQD